jgi:hypothetical protein
MVGQGPHDHVLILSVKHVMKHKIPICIFGDFAVVGGLALNPPVPHINEGGIAFLEFARGLIHIVDMPGMGFKGEGAIPIVKCLSIKRSLFSNFLSVIGEYLAFDSKYQSQADDYSDPWPGTELTDALGFHSSTSFGSNV